MSARLADNDIKNDATRHRRWRTVAITIGYVAALTLFAIRGPARLISRVPPDLPVFYAAGIAWLQGDDPYDTVKLQSFFHENGGPEEGHVQLLMNPPTSLPFFAALSVFSFPVTNIVVMIGNCLLVVVLLVLLRRTFPDEVPKGVGWHILVILTIAWGPTLTSISQGQNTLVGMALLVLGVGLVNAERYVRAGVVFAIASAIRPSMFVVMTVWYLLGLPRTWRLGTAGVVMLLLIAAIGIGRFHLADVDWQTSMASNIAAFRQSEMGLYGAGSGSIEADRPNRFIMLNLQPLLSTYFGPGAFSKYAPLVCMSTLAAMLFWCRRRGTRPVRFGLNLLDLSILVVLTLLAFYNRYYSAVLLIVPLGWSLGAWHCPRLRWHARATFFTLLVFLVPGVAVLLHWLPKDMLTTWWADRLILPHQSYSLLIALGIMMTAACFVPHDNAAALDQDQPVS